MKSHLLFCLVSSFVILSTSLPQAKLLSEYFTNLPNERIYYFIAAYSAEAVHMYDLESESDQTPYYVSRVAVPNKGTTFAGNYYMPCLSYKQSEWNNRCLLKPYTQTFDITNQAVSNIVSLSQVCNEKPVKMNFVQEGYVLQVFAVKKSVTDSDPAIDSILLRYSSTGDLQRDSNYRNGTSYLCVNYRYGSLGLSVLDISNLPVYPVNFSNIDFEYPLYFPVCPSVSYNNFIPNYVDIYNNFLSATTQSLKNIINSNYVDPITSLTDRYNSDTTKETNYYYFRVSIGYDTFKTEIFTLNSTALTMSLPLSYNLKFENGVLLVNITKSNTVSVFRGIILHSKSKVLFRLKPSSLMG
eukprot:TRINITY_DN6639_c0_g1_i2.p1 TRINITY_DN6639_c0_g1~~TRINITY_DN6639_c0_g1_i2.p1  ORF type:complete len:355 (+),score=16.52 TRINITY_DN6639_c0_g1_i2:625-1689(+)